MWCKGSKKKSPNEKKGLKTIVKTTKGWILQGWEHGCPQTAVMSQMHQDTRGKPLDNQLSTCKTWGTGNRLASQYLQNRNSPVATYVTH